MTNPAQDEYDRLISSSTRTHLTHHRHDSSSSASSSGSPPPNPSNIPSTADRTSYPSASRPAQKTIRSSTRRTHRNTSASSSASETDGPPLWSSKTQQPTTNLPRGKHLVAANTGPKGVITDAWAAAREAAIVAAAKRKGGAGVAVVEELREGGPRAGAWERGAGYVREEGLDDEEEGEDGGFGEDGQEDEYMARWRETRRKELLASSRAAGRGGGGGNGRGGEGGRYGKLEQVDASGFLDAVENTPASTVVVVYISDDDNPLSNLYTTHLTHLSQKHTHTRFLSLPVQEAEIEAEGVPALLGYKGGTQFVAIVPLVDEVRVTCNVVANLEGCLRGWGMV